MKSLLFAGPMITEKSTKTEETFILGIINRQHFNFLYLGNSNDFRDVEVSCHRLQAFANQVLKIQLN